MFFKKKKSKRITWAENEINKVKAFHDNEYDHMLYNDVLELYTSVNNVLKKQDHSGFSYSAVTHMLERLLASKPLSPITEEDFFINQDEMVQTSEEYLKENNLKSYLQCYRASSVFRKEYIDGTVEYSDVDRIRGIDQYGVSYYGGGIKSYCEDIIPPITMPYMPVDKPIKVYTWDFTYDKDAENKFYVERCECNSTYIEKVVFPDGRTVKVNRLYIGDELTEISKEDFKKLKKIIEADVKEFNNACVTEKID